MKYSPCLLIIDFDGVLFDDVRFKKEWELLFQRAGIHPEVFEKTYQESKKQKGYYDPRIHVRLALRSFSAASVTEKNLFSRIKKIIDQSSRFIFDDVREFLVFLKDEGINAVLLSTGDTVFQNQKIIKSGIAEFFSEIVIIPDVSKVTAVDLIMRKKRPIRGFFIDDKKEVVEGVKRSLANVYVAQMRRDSMQLPASNIDFSAKNFSEYATYIKKECNTTDDF